MADRGRRFSIHGCFHDDKPQLAAGTAGPREAKIISRVEAFRLGCVGDINLGGELRQRMAVEGTAFPFARVHPALAQHDVLFGNLECCALPENALARAPRPAMTAATSQLTALTDAGFRVVSLANNHVMDAGAEGLEAMLAQLASMGISAVGAGADVNSAVRPLVTMVGGRRIGFLAACDHSPSWARRGRPGIAPLDWRRLRAQVAELAAETDLVIAALHADVEFASVPSPWRIRAVHRLVEAGAHLVIQHHPHVWQGIEYYQHGLIAYSLGNFVFELEGNSYQQYHPQTKESFILTVEVGFGQRGQPDLFWQATPVTIGTDHRPFPVPDAAQPGRIRELERLCALLGDARQLRRYWKEHCLAELQRTLYAVYYTGRRGNHRAALRGLLDAVRRPEERRYLWGALSGGRY
ncbi:MAG: CapA family protein [Nitrococcus mobilis]|nr:CapA family protein [Nitrococcus mobilis]